MRFLFLCAVIVATFFTLSRTQVNEHAKFFRRDGQILEGRVSRDFISGDFLIQTSDGVLQVPQAQFVGMVYEGSAISVPLAWVGGAAILVAGLFSLGWPGPRGWSRRMIVRPQTGIVHDVLPPSKRES